MSGPSEGPWKVVHIGDDWWAILSNGAVCCTSEEHAESECAMLNAAEHKRAAAEEMFAACEEALRVLTYNVKREDNSMRFQAQRRAKESLEAALTKARGQQ
jgi:hypothetical protein